MQTDKIQSGLIDFYTNHFATLKDKKINLLELGVLNGGSLRWAENFFTNGIFVGLDIRDTNIKFLNRTSIFIANQNDSLALQELGNKYGNFDIIIDDCSHYGDYTQRSFDFLFKYLVSGGQYIIEDWDAGFRSPEFRGIDDVICNCVKNFNNYRIQSIDILKWPSVVIIKKM